MAVKMEIKRNILLNPGPATTTDTVKLAQVISDICPREEEFQKIMEQMRKDLVRIVHGDEEIYTSVLFCGSGTICMDVCLNSLLPEGKEILIINNGAYSQRAVEICIYYGLPYKELKYPEDTLPDLEQLRQTLVDNPDIAVVYTTHNETGTGLLNPVREMGAIVHEIGGVFVVDTTSTYALRPIDIEEENIDFCMASAQKGLMSMTGLSFVIGKRALIEASATYPKRSYYCNLYMQYHFFETTGQMHFTPPVQTAYATKQAITEYFAEGEYPKWERHNRVFQALYDGLIQRGFSLLLPPDVQAGLVVCAYYPEDDRWDFDVVHDYCYERGYTIYPGKISGANTFRLCALGAIDEEDIQGFYKVFDEALKILGM